MVWLSFGINVCLTLAKLVAMIMSGSLAVFASFLDSCLDLLSGSIIFITDRIISRDNVYKYPIGRKRMEVLAVIGFSAAMFAAAAQVIVQAIQTLADIQNFDLVLNLVTGIILTSTIIVKLFLWLLCRRFRSPSVRALAADHRNDVFSNIIGFAAALIGMVFISPPTHSSTPFSLFILSHFIFCLTLLCTLLYLSLTISCISLSFESHCYAFCSVLDSLFVPPSIWSKQ